VSSAKTATQASGSLWCGAMQVVEVVVVDAVTKTKTARNFSPKEHTSTSLMRHVSPRNGKTNGCGQTIMYTISSRSIIQRGSGDFQTISSTQTIIKNTSGFALIRSSELVFFRYPSRII